jgi:hypothetical protein
MALPTQGRVLLDTTAGDIDIELWSKVRDATITCAALVCNKYIMFVGSTESMPEFHSVGHGRYALLPTSGPYIWLCNFYNCCAYRLL